MIRRKPSLQVWGALPAPTFLIRTFMQNFMIIIVHCMLVTIATVPLRYFMAHELFNSVSHIEIQHTQKVRAVLRHRIYHLIMSSIVCGFPNW